MLTSAKDEEQRFVSAPARGPLSDKSERVRRAQTCERGHVVA
jgi:hypothetical protein